MGKEVRRILFSEVVRMTIVEIFSGPLSSLSICSNLCTGYYSFADLRTLPVENTSHFEGPFKKNILRFMDPKSQLYKWLNAVR